MVGNINTFTFLIVSLHSKVYWSWVHDIHLWKYPFSSAKKYDFDCNYRQIKTPFYLVLAIWMIHLRIICTCVRYLNDWYLIMYLGILLVFDICMIDSEKCIFLILALFVCSFFVLLIFENLSWHYLCVWDKTIQGPPGRHLMIISAHKI